MSTLAKEVEQACVALGLRFEPGYSLALRNGVVVQAVALIHDLGHRNGTLIVNSLDHFAELSRELVEAGYGVSMMGSGSDNSQFDLQSWRETFIDWGWSGDPDSRPTWMGDE